MSSNNDLGVQNAVQAAPTSRVEESGAADAPFFVVGVSRSGTTLLRLMLNRHSRLCVPPESHFIPHLCPDPSAPAPQAEAFFQRLAEHFRYREWELSDEVVQERLRSAPSTWPGLFDAVFGAYAEAEGKPRWGDKTPPYVTRIGLLAKIFPEARFIHLVRDGRDVYCSHRDLGWLRHGPVTTARRWREYALTARRQGRALPEGRYLEVRYEDLTADAEATLRRVCEHLGERFEPAMLESHVGAASQLPAHRLGFHPNISSPVSTHKSARWRTEMSRTDAALYEFGAGDALEAFGYERSGRMPIEALPKLAVCLTRIARRKAMRRLGWSRRRDESDDQAAANKDQHGR